MFVYKKYWNNTFSLRNVLIGFFLTSICLMFTSPLLAFDEKTQTSLSKNKEGTNPDDIARMLSKLKQLERELNTLKVAPGLTTSTETIDNDEQQGGHDSHHPQNDTSPSDKKPPHAKKMKPNGMGPNMNQKMARMMEQMGAPKPKDLYPTLMRLQSIGPVEREEVFQKADERMRGGNALIQEGIEKLLIAAPGEDLKMMQEGIEVLREGTAQFDSGLAAKRALIEGQEPRRVALSWFKTQMNILPSSPQPEKTLFLGLSPFHASAMLILIIFVVAMFYIYALKMRRASALLAELKTEPSNQNLVASDRGISSEKPIASVSSTSESPLHSDYQSSTTRPSVFVGDMTILGIFDETHDVKTFRFGSKEGRALPFKYEPGQFVTFTLNIPNQSKPIKRSYTIASSPSQRDYFEVTIKRESHGLVSRYMHDSLAVGDALLVKAPGGKFYFNGRNTNSIVLISGGVGITPMMSAVRYLTATCWQGDIYFLFCARSTNDFIFEQELKYLQARHPNLHVLVSMTQAKGTSWMGPQGRFTSAQISDFVPDIANQTVHLCGPPPMMEALSIMLLELGVDNKRIKTEAFGGAAKKTNAQDMPPENSNTSGLKHEVRFSTSNKKALASENDTLLDIAEQLDIEIDNSCRAGTCGSCKVKLLAGQVNMEVEDGLDTEDKNQGFVLACQSVPKSNVEVDA